MKFVIDCMKSDLVNECKEESASGREMYGSKLEMKGGERVNKRKT